MSQLTSLAVDESLASYFFDQFERAQQRDSDALDDEIEAYVIHLLVDHLRRPNVAGRTSPALATQYLAARERGATALREVGDRALYIAGVVPRSLDRSPVDVRYVAGIGEAAYRGVHARQSRLELFERLADGFGSIIALLARVLEGEGGDLLAVYERWRRHDDPRDEARLVEAGVLLDPEAADRVH